MQITKVIVANARNGGALYSDTSVHTPVGFDAWGTIYIVNDTVFTTLTGNVDGITGSSVSFKAGELIEGRFTVLTLASGAVIAYKSEH